MTSCGVGVPSTIENVGVVCKIKTGDNSKGYVMQNTKEGEIILPPGTKLKVQNVSKGTKEYPVWGGLDQENPRLSDMLL